MTNVLAKWAVSLRDLGTSHRPGLWGCTRRRFAAARRALPASTPAMIAWQPFASQRPLDRNPRLLGMHPGFKSGMRALSVPRDARLGDDALTQWELHEPPHHHHRPYARGGTPHACPKPPVPPILRPMTNSLRA